MSTPRLGCFLLLFIASMFADKSPAKELERYVVIERVAKNYEADKAGLQEGDIVSHWKSGAIRGDIESPFDLLRIEIDQSPRSEVTLEGSRGPEKRAWKLGPNDWGIKARPGLPKDILSVYLDGQELAKTNKPVQAAHRWRTAALQIEDPDANPLAAWLLLQAGNLLAETGQWAEAGDMYKQAIGKAEEAGPAIAAPLIHLCANTFRDHNDWTGALKYSQQSLVEYQKIGTESFTVASALNDAGAASLQLGDPVRAEEYFRKALALQKKLAANSLPVAMSLSNLGRLAWNRGDLTKAEEYYSQALAIREKLAPDSIVLATTLTSLGVVAWRHSDLKKAGEYLGSALVIQQKVVPGSPDVATSLNNLGIIMSEQGDLVKAEEYYRSALEIQEAQMPGSVNVASMLLNMGNLAWERGDLANAESYYQRALAIREKLAPGSLDVAAGLTNLGDVDWERGALRAAEEHYKKALAIQEKQAPGSIDVAMSLNNLGVVAWSRRHLALAQAHYERALAIEQKLAPRGLLSAEILNGLGDVARDRNDLTKAEEYYRRAVAIRENTAPGSTGHAESLAALASIMRRKQHLDEAAQLYGQCLTAIENQTTRLGGGEEVRSSFRAKHARCYRDYIDLLLTRKQPELAFDVLERSRARTLLEMLAGAHVDIRKGVDPLLLQRELSLQRQIDEESDRNSRLPNAEHDEDGTTSKKKLEEFLNQYRQIEGQIRASSPNYAALTGAQPLSVKAVQQQLLDDDTLLLEYALGNDHSFLWAVTPSSLRAYELPGRSKIDSLARRVYDLLTARNLHLTGETELLRQARLAKAEAEYPEAVAALSRIVLGPVAEQLQGKRLLIVSDGALEYIPFAVLPTPLTRGQHPQSPASVSFQPLISQHEIVNLPSASALAVLRHQLIGRKQATKAVAVLADPVFDTYDDRIHIVSRDQGPMDRKSSEPSAPFPSRVNAAIDRSANEPSRPAMRPFPRLPFTRREAEAIYAIAEEGSAIKVLDFDASKAMATSAELKDYSIVHFATHGVLDSEHPELSGLVFSLVDRQGKPQNGFVRLLDIYNLDLNADLVVLSACRTALGKQISGEGLVGLTRGFIFAGAARVAASVWNVDDEATAEFMKKFYEGMLKEHQSPAQALRSAQVWMLGQKTWRSPYYWAAFVLQGEWR